MKLIFLYGPPAVGKLTVAQILEKQTGFKLLHNHMIINLIIEIFGWNNPSRRILVREFRLRILEEAAKNDLSLIITVGSAGPQIFDYFDAIIHGVESQGGTICLVHLTSAKETLLERVTHPSRKAQGKDFGKERMEELFSNYPHVFDHYSQKEHITIDTTTLSPEVSAQKIIEHYLLPVRE